MNQKAAAAAQSEAETGNRTDIPESLVTSSGNLKALFWAAAGTQRAGTADVFGTTASTRACNLACAYCDFGASQAPQATMDYRIATAAVD